MQQWKVVIVLTPFPPSEASKTGSAKCRVTRWSRPSGGDVVLGVRGCPFSSTDMVRVTKSWSLIFYFLWSPNVFFSVRNIHPKIAQSKNPEGKTYSMFGEGAGNSRGMIPRCMEEVFTQLERRSKVRRFTSARRDTDRAHTLSCCDRDSRFVRHIEEV